MKVSLLICCLLLNGLRTQAQPRSYDDTHPSENSGLYTSHRSKDAYHKPQSLSWTQYDWRDYYQYSDIVDWMEKMASKYPDIVSLEEIGRSYLGKELMVAKVTASQKQLTPAIWIEAGVHGPEYIAPATLTYIMNKLVTEDAYRDFLSNIVIYFMPVVNPDGYDYTFKKPANRFWMKTRSSTSSIFGCDGVDLDHNWSYNWSGGRVCADDFPGDRPFSEVETQAIRRKILYNIPLLKGYISFRSYGQNWLFPWGSECSVVNDEDVIVTAVEAAYAIEQYRHTPYYAVAQSMALCTQCTMSQKYRGGSLDWMYAVAGIQYPYVVNLPDTGMYGYDLPVHNIIPVAEETFLGVDVVLKRIAYATKSTFVPPMIRLHRLAWYCAFVPGSHDVI